MLHTSSVIQIKDPKIKFETRLVNGRQKSPSIAIQGTRF